MADLLETQATIRTQSHPPIELLVVRLILPYRLSFVQAPHTSTSTLTISTMALILLDYRRSSDSIFLDLKSNKVEVMIEISSAYVPFTVSS